MSNEEMEKLIDGAESHSGPIAFTILAPSLTIRKEPKTVPIAIDATPDVETAGLRWVADKLLYVAQPGIYSFSASFIKDPVTGHPSAHDDVFLEIYKQNLLSGSDWKRLALIWAGVGSTSERHGAAMTAAFHVDQGDVVELRARSDNDNATIRHLLFSMHLIR